VGRTISCVAISVVQAQFTVPRAATPPPTFTESSLALAPKLARYLVVLVTMMVVTLLSFAYFTGRREVQAKGGSF